MLAVVISILFKNLKLKMSNEWGTDSEKDYWKGEDINFENKESEAIRNPHSIFIFR